MIPSLTDLFEACDCVRPRELLRELQARLDATSPDIYLLDNSNDLILHGMIGVECDRCLNLGWAPTERGKRYVDIMACRGSQARRGGAQAPVLDIVGDRNATGMSGPEGPGPHAEGVPAAAAE